MAHHQMELWDRDYIDLMGPGLSAAKAMMLNPMNNLAKTLIRLQNTYILNYFQPRT